MVTKLESGLCDVLKSTVIRLEDGVLGVSSLESSVEKLDSNFFGRIRLGVNESTGYYVLVATIYSNKMCYALHEICLGVPISKGSLKYKLSSIPYVRGKREGIDVVKLTVPEITDIHYLEVIKKIKRREVKAAFLKLFFVRGL
jgi:hypothetical protein